MTNITSKAKVTQVAIGTLTVEGLMLPDGTFAIGVSQVAELFSLLKQNATREVKALLGAGFPLLKAASELNSQQVNILTLEQFQKVTFALALKGNKQAIEFGQLLFGLSLHQLFSDAFGVKCEQEQRQQWLKERMVHKKQYHEKLTIWLQHDGCENYGKEINIFKACANLPIKPVDEYDDEELRRLNCAEVTYNLLRKLGKNHQDALALMDSK